MKKYILELSQNKADKVYKNGDWENLLSKEILIEEGDEISIKNVFLDTISQSSGDVLIEKDITLEIENGLYINNWDTTDKHYGTIDTEYKPDGYDYILSYFTDASKNLLRWTAVRWQVSPNPAPEKTVEAIFEYTDPSGQLHYYHQKLPKQNDAPAPEFNLNIADGSGLLVEPGSITLTNEKELEDYYFFVKNITSPVGSGGTPIFHPITFRTSLDLEAGSYDPQLLANKLSRLFSRSSYSQLFDRLDDTNFLKSVGTIKNKDNYGIPIFVRSDGKQILEFTNDDYYAGTNQIQFNYDPEVRRFSIDFLHMPYYDNSNISVIYKNDGSSSKIFSSSKNAGLFFTSLNAKDSSGNNYDFWGSKLGFTVPDITTQFKHFTSGKTFTLNDTSTLANPELTIPTTWQNGVNITEGFKGLDQIVDKSGTNFQKLPSLPVKSETNAQTIIEAENEYTDNILTDSHFLIEIQSSFNNNFINSDSIINTITGIINRYYGFESFTASGSEASINYIHKGQPVFLKSFKIRILEPSNMEVPPIGDKNYLYLEINKP